MPTRNVSNHICSSGVALIVAVTVLRPALPRRRLVNQINRKPATEKDRLEAFSAIGRGLPGLRELPCAMQKHEWELPRIRGNLVEDVGVVAV